MSNIILSLSPTSYMEKISKILPKVKRRKVITDKDFIIPKINEYEKLIEFNYKVKYLKIISKYYKQKLSGNKNELNARLYNYLRLSSKCLIIQKKWKLYILRHYNNARGPAIFNRKTCVNETDFYTMVNVKDIVHSQFISYKDDKEGQIYGFDIVSLFNLYKKGNYKKIKNPYNRNLLPNNLKNNINFILKYSNLFKENIDIEFRDEEALSPEKQMDLRILSLFQEIDNLGNYTNQRWFTELRRVDHIRFIRELADIWTYRAQLSDETRHAICPPVGDPFRNVNLHSLPNVTPIILKKICLTIMEDMVNRGTNESNRGLGANYVLCALTLVNQNAAECLPWLYQSVVHYE